MSTNIKTLFTDVAKTHDLTLTYDNVSADRDQEDSRSEDEILETDGYSGSFEKNGLNYNFAINFNGDFSYLSCDEANHASQKDGNIFTLHGRQQEKKFFDKFSSFLVNDLSSFETRVNAFLAIFQKNEELLSLLKESANIEVRSDSVKQQIKLRLDGYSEQQVKSLVDFINNLNSQVK